MRNKIVMCGAAGLLALSSSPALAGPKSGAELAISLTVPQACSIDADTLTITANGATAAGSVFEHCNGSGGYQLFASHRSLSANEAVSVIYDGVPAPASKDGMTAVASRRGATFRRVPIELKGANLESSFSISLTLTAI